MFFKNQKSKTEITIVLEEKIHSNKIISPEQTKSKFRNYSSEENCKGKRLAHDNNDGEKRTFKKKNNKRKTKQSTATFMTMKKKS